MNSDLRATFVPSVTIEPIATPIPIATLLPNSTIVPSVTFDPKATIIPNSNVVPDKNVTLNPEFVAYMTKDNTKYTNRLYFFIALILSTTAAIYANNNKYVYLFTFIVAIMASFIGVSLITSNYLF